ncbi:peptide-N(4)-(N-acetyl-beta-glucosaminyl)asparagine amidase [Sitodiplosis mosellana]|uniref:peptide-N(4)-(N-acetyl-beta- glucosaminyl)asparagine amidase n=1 Tax=Sitodiplosis mosellana TaxID=263140 RepID=UPI0024444813|nr:peptide-N(4)-(N-acetyl-beta-glucosaminyl)asparagine amidase [Sitodiplosis mosellana]
MMASSLNYEREVLNLESITTGTKYIESVTILLKILDNVIREPQNDKYRTIRLENKIIKEKLLCLNGVRAFLEKIGFVEVNGALNLPTNVLIATIRKYRDQLNERFEVIKNGTNDSIPLSQPAKISAKPSGSSVGAIKRRPTKIVPLKPYRERINFEKVVPFQNAFLQNLEFRSDEVMQYEDDRLQYYGRRMIPIRTLTENTIKNMRAVQKEQYKQPLNKEIKDPSFDDWLLVELTKWFNESFFEWVNTLPCKVCGQDDARTKGSQVENDTRVEVLYCCNTQTKFYRYNDVAQLLLTRKGRCGEYANCFTFLCRCLGYEARLVQATFDHVWTEVFSEAQNRWIHIDPSDNVVDAPLMYQHGWKRKVDYIIAFSHEDIQDVTWRYASNHEEATRNRQRCTEPEVLKTILLLRDKRQMNLSVARKKYLKKRNLREIIELMVQREPTENEKKGRSSGSLSWRLTRGEDQQCTSNNFFVFNATETEANAKEFNVRFSSAKNEYERYLHRSNGVEPTETAKTWQSCAYRWEKIFRKEERDWKMVYLARAEDSDRAEIEWKFDFSDRNLKIKDISFKFDVKTYENGQIEVTFLHKGKVLPNFQSIKNLDSFTINVQLSGGNGDCAWQHTQLFRQSIASINEFPFDLNITFF